MRGIPKYLNTKEDYMNFLAMDEPTKEQKIESLQELLDGIYDWFSVGPTTEEEGITDETHKVEVDEDPETGEKNYTQYEWKKNPTAKLFDIGFTEEEVIDLINSLKEGE